MGIKSHQLFQHGLVHILAVFNFNQRFIHAVAIYSEQSQGLAEVLHVAYAHELGVAYTVMQYYRAHHNQFGYHDQVVQHTQQIFSNVKEKNRSINFGYILHIQLKHSQVYTVGMLNFNQCFNADRLVISKVSDTQINTLYIVVLVVCALSNSTQLVSCNNRMQTRHPRERHNTSTVSLLQQQNTNRTPSRTTQRSRTRAGGGKLEDWRVGRSSKQHTVTHWRSSGSVRPAFFTKSQYSSSAMPISEWFPFLNVVLASAPCWC